MKTSTLLFALFITILPKSSMAQDERYFRKLFSGEFKKKFKKEKEISIARAFSPFYQIDLNADFRKENILIENFNDQARIHIYDFQKKPLYSYTFDSFGSRSSVYKVEMRALHESLRILLVYIYEGKSDYLEFEGQGRVYFLTMDKLDLKGFNVFKGPIVWHEKKGLQGNYHQRFKNVSLIDFNEDGVKEVMVNYQKIKSVFFYRGKGKWSSAGSHL